MRAKGQVRELGNLKGHFGNVGLNNQEMEFGNYELRIGDLQVELGN